MPGLKDVDPNQTLTDAVQQSRRAVMQDARHSGHSGALAYSPREGAF
jgi:hypothetical protein